MPKASPSAAPQSFESAMQELEQLVSRIESGQLPLDDLLGGYQRGAELLKFCRDKLQVLDEQVRLLDEGTLKPWSQE